MKAIKRIVGVCAMLFATNCLGSEGILTLDYKLLVSDLVVIGTVTDVRLGDIRSLNESDKKTQDTKIRFRIDECIFGEGAGEICFVGHSVSFSDGASIHDSTAGFSSHGVRKNVRYIAYLKKSKEGYVLSEDSNQFLEEMDKDSKTVRDIGQTSRMVPFELKRKQLLELAERRRMQARQDGGRQPATRAELKSEGSDKPQPESEGRFK